MDVFDRSDAERIARSQCDDLRYDMERQITTEASERRNNIERVADDLSAQSGRISSSVRTLESDLTALTTRIASLEDQRQEGWVKELVSLCQEDIFTDAHEYYRRVGRAQDLAIAIAGGPDPEPQPQETEACC